MLVNFFMALRNKKLPVTLTKLFTLLECLQRDMAFASIDAFNSLSRLCMVQDKSISTNSTGHSPAI